jgi:hypothetical protein
VTERLRAAPFAGGGSAHLQWDRGRGLGHVLDWLEQQPGATWQDRWIASRADEHGNSAWRQLPATWLAAAGRGLSDPANTSLMLGRAMLALVCGDVVRPSPAWLLTPITARNLVAELARTRDPVGFTALKAVCQAEAVNTLTTQLACRRIAIIVAAKGGLISHITIGDCLELLRIADDVHDSAGATSPYFYQLLRTMGVLPGGAPAVRGLRTQGQLGCEQLIDRYQIACGPVRDLLVDYLRERQPAVDYATLHKLSYTLGRLFWRDLERHEPGIDSLRLPPEAAAAWKRRITTRSVRSGNGDGEMSLVTVPRLNAIDHMLTVRSFYLDLTQWAADDPARWGPWVAPCPVRDGDVAQLTKTRSHRKSRMDQRTRERVPVLPVLLAAVDRGHAAALQRLQVAQITGPGQHFTAAGQALTRSRTTHASAGKTWAEDPATGKRRDLTLEEHQAFWTWAAVHILRDTGIFSGGRYLATWTYFWFQQVSRWSAACWCATGVVEGRERACHGRRVVALSWAMSSRLAARAAARSSSRSATWSLRSIACCSRWVIFWLRASTSGGVPSPDSRQACSPSASDRRFSSWRTRSLSRTARSWAACRSACSDVRVTAGPAPPAGAGGTASSAWIWASRSRCR